MKFRKHILSFILCLLFLPQQSGCIREEYFPDTPHGNFDELWRIIDEQYCFLTWKGIDWNEVRDRYRPWVKPDMSDNDLFRLMGDMLSELRDGHVNLYSDDDIIRSWSWYEDYPANFSETLLSKYLQDECRLSGGICYTKLNSRIGYMYYESFTSNLSQSDMDDILLYFSGCDGIIIDIRNNGGGTLTNSSLIASRFVRERLLTGYVCHKTGKGHNDFSTPVPIYVEPWNGIRWEKPVVVLTNRQAYSAANDFANSMRYLPNVTLMGDRTGGGSGLPFTSELPNGWGVRYSASPHFDADLNHLEEGVAPNIAVELSREDEEKGFDTLIETAIAYLSKNISNNLPY